MPVALDLNLLPIFREAGQDLSELPGLHLAAAPRRAARGRSGDRLILYLALSGTAPLAPGKLDQILAGLAKTYFDTPGSVTAAMRTVAEALNQFLLDRNLHNASSGRQATGLFSQVVVRNEQFFLAQSGPVHAFFATASGALHLYDPQLSGRGLGLSRTTTIRYYQADLQANDTLLLATKPAPGWNKTSLTGIHGQGPESLRRRLGDRAALNLNAVLVQAKPGKGGFHLLRTQNAAQASAPAEPGQAAAPAETQPSGPESPARAPGPAVPGPLTVPPRATPPRTEQQPAQSVAQPPAAVPAATAGEPGPAYEETPPVIATAPMEPHAAPAPAGDMAGGEALPFEPDGDAVEEEDAPAAMMTDPSPSAPPRRGANLAPVGDFFARLGSFFVRGLRGLERLLRGLARRLLPDDALASIPATTMAFIAVAVPVVIVAVASAVYFQLGRNAQYQILFEQAEQMAAQAATRSDPMARRADLETILVFLRQAEGYRTTNEAQALRTQARAALDELDLVRRVSYRPAVVNGLDATVRVTRMASAEGDLYMLDGATGSVLRAQLTSQGYQLDRSFQCGPDEKSDPPVGPLLDIAGVPAGVKAQASLLALDANGALLLCSPGQSQQAISLAPPDREPSVMKLNGLAGFTFALDNFYLLDPDDDAVWIYWNGGFLETPQFFFGDSPHPALQDVTDLAVNNDELYLLHADGHLTLCYFSNLIVSPTRCSDPAYYIDMRPGRENTPLVPSTPFTQILFNPPPDPSLFLLEPKSQAIYHFSLRNLAFQRQYLPAEGLPARAATAFAVNPLERTFFLAIENNVYYGNIP